MQKIMPLFTGYTKLLVGLGLSSFEVALNSIEIIDLGSSSTTCHDLIRFPIPTSSAFGGLTSNRNPNICGGHDLKRDCKTFENGVWTSSPSLNYERSNAAAVRSPYPNSTHSLFVTGGKYKNDQIDNTAEVLTDAGWQTLPTTLPVTIRDYCMVLLNLTTVLIIGGWQNDKYDSPDTFYFNTDKEKWIKGPMLKFGRSSHNCGKIQSDSQSSEFSVVVAGGWSKRIEHMSSVEVLDVRSSEWRAGPSLPIGINGASMVEDHSGGVLLIGGANGTFLGTIYRLAHANSGWILLPQKLKVARIFATAFLVPDEITNCI